MEGKVITSKVLNNMSGPKKLYWTKCVLLHHFKGTKLSSISQPICVIFDAFNFVQMKFYRKKLQQVMIVLFSTYEYQIKSFEQVGTNARKLRCGNTIAHA